jgi:putative nucleotidyltransferase with HDIG domain
MQRDYSVFQVLLQSSLVLNTRSNLDHLLDRIVQEAITIIDAEAATLWLVTDNNSIEISPKSIRGPVSSSLAKMKIRLGEGIVGQVILSGKPEFVEDVHLDPRWAERFDQETGFITNSMLCLPLKTESKTFGALQLLNKKDGSLFSKEDLELATAFTNLASLAYENNRLYLRQQHWFTNILDALVTAVELRSPDSNGHSTRVAYYAESIGQDLGLTGQQLTHLKWGSYLHDIGKLMIAGEDEESYRRHPELGARIMSKIDPDNDLEDLYFIVACHHQYVGGTGFPQDNTGTDAPLLAQIVGLANLFDHLVTKGQMDFKTAAGHLASEKKFDARLGEVLVRLASHWENHEMVSQRLQKWL